MCGHAQDDWSIYYDLIKEMREAQARRERQSEWLSWHEGCHLISKNPKGSKTYKKVLECLSGVGMSVEAWGGRGRGGGALGSRGGHGYRPGLRVHYGGLKVLDRQTWGEGEGG